MSDYDEEYDEDYDEEDRDDEDEEDLEYNDFGHIPSGQVCDNHPDRRATKANNDEYLCNECSKD